MRADSLSRDAFPSEPVELGTRTDAYLNIRRFYAHQAQHQIDLSAMVDFVF